jgi:parvulin-like peptidyl-prolyl isomerase
MPLIVNGEPIDDNAIRMEADRLRPRLREAMPDQAPRELEERVAEWARENVIEGVLLRQAVLAEPEAEIGAGLNSDGEALILPPGRDHLTSETETRKRVERFLSRLLEKLAPPRSKEVSEYYRKHRDEFFTRELAHAAHIVKHANEQTTSETALEQMREIRAEWERGADFAELADRHSDSPGRGGDLGYFARGQMVAQFETVVFALRPGEVSDIFRTPFGYHMAKLFDKKPEGIRPLNDVKAHIEAVLYGEKKQRRVDQFLDGLRAKAVITDQTS